jgi:hypothetical protein
MPDPIKLVALIEKLHRAGGWGARRSALVSALAGGGIGAVTGSPDSRLADFLRGSLIGGGAGLGAHVGMGRGGAAIVNRFARREALGKVPSARSAVAQLLGGTVGGGAIGGGLGGLGGGKLDDLIGGSLGSTKLDDLLAKYAAASRNGELTKTSGAGLVVLRKFFADMYDRLFSKLAPVEEAIARAQGGFIPGPEVDKEVVEKAKAVGQEQLDAAQEEKSSVDRHNQTGAAAVLLELLGQGAFQGAWTKGVLGKHIGLGSSGIEHVPKDISKLRRAFSKLYPHKDIPTVVGGRSGVGGSPFYGTDTHTVGWPQKYRKPSRSILAHEFGHAAQGWNPFSERLLRMGVLGGTAGSLGAVFSDDEKSARIAALLGTASSAPLVSSEIGASYRGSRLMKEVLKGEGKLPSSIFSKSRLLSRPWLGVPTYALAATTPLHLYGLKRLFGGYKPAVDGGKIQKILAQIGYGK